MKSAFALGVHALYEPSVSMFLTLTSPAGGEGGGGEGKGGGGEGGGGGGICGSGEGGGVLGEK